MDPCVEEIKRFCGTLRRNAKDDRILFHYNGHGVPQPTPSGEIWVFNRGYTQYIPVSLRDLQSWLGAPCIFVWDCHSAGHIVNNFKRFVQKRIEDERTNGKDPSSTAPASSYKECLQLAACQANECLPMHPDLPADIFTCCLTTPIDISIKWFVMQNPLLKTKYPNLTIPGKLADRRTPLGELNWIFTAITDTVAWTTLPRPVFKRLFRQDLMVAALFRNFLLADRILRVCNCHPVSDPPLPSTNNHSMWDAWDLALDQCLSQLPMLHAAEKPGGKPYEYKHSSFFEEHLTAFEIWLRYGSNTKKAPEQLPVVLQVLLSQVHRLRALILLSRFLDLGPWAVYLALSIGIFPYVLKLLQSPAQDLKPVLVFIWTRIMSVDYKNAQQELMKDKGYAYFIQILVPQSNMPPFINNVSEHRAMCAFVLSLFCKGFKQGQTVCMCPEVLNACLIHTGESETPLLRQWAALCISQLWNEYPEGKWLGMREDAPDRLCDLLMDPIPEVRTSCVIALTTFLGNDKEELSSEFKQQEIKLATAVLGLTGDGSGIVRREIVVFLSRFVKRYLAYFLVAAYGQLEEEIAMMDDPSSLPEVRRSSPAYGTVFSSAWKALLTMSEDPFTEVKIYASKVVDYVFAKMDESPLAQSKKEIEQYLIQKYSSTSNGYNNSNMNENGTENGNGNGSNNNRLESLSNQKPLLKRNLSSHSMVISTKSLNGNSSPVPDRKIQHHRSVSSIGLGGILQKLGLGMSDDHPENESVNGAKSHSNLIYMPYGSWKKPPTPRLQSNDNSETEDDILNLPLSSGFFEWSCEYFQEPLLGHADVDEPGSEEYIQRVWRRNRNEKIMIETQPQKDLAINGNWKSTIGSLNNLTQPKKLLFAQFEPNLVSIDDRDGVSIWDWSLNSLVNRFSNCNPFGSKITEVKFINEDDIPLLLTGSSDGVVRIFKNYQSEEKVQLVSAWRALADLLPTSKSTGLVADWQQSRGALLVGGDVKVIRVWDAPRELCISDIPARSSSTITSLTSDQVAGHVFVAGFGDGFVRVYDRRMDSRESMVQAWRNRGGWVVNTHMQRGGYRELVTGSSEGFVSLWDIRMKEPVESFRAHEKTMTGIQVHEHAPVVVTGSRLIRLWTTAGDLVSTVKNPSGYMLQNRNPYVSAVAFHPHRMILAANSSHDTTINLFSCTENLQHNI